MVLPKKTKEKRSELLLAMKNQNLSQLILSYEIHTPSLKQVGHQILNESSQNIVYHNCIYNVHKSTCMSINVLVSFFF